MPCASACSDAALAPPPCRAPPPLAASLASCAGSSFAALEPGCEIDLIPEQKAAKEALEAESGLSKELAAALYQAPGSQ